jgi:phosphatidate phosphatase APP1
MNRPQLVNFSAIASENQIALRASLTLAEIDNLSTINKNKTPFDSIHLFQKEMFRSKIVGLNKDDKIIFVREYDSDNYGRFKIKLPTKVNGSHISKLMIYETAFIKGIDLYLGSFLPLIINREKKLVISDFDKTLVDTKYSTPTEMYYSLNRPLNFFPSVNESILKLKEYIEAGHQPFILSASPHFYVNAIRDWLYQNRLFVSDILLKDYRDFISIFDGALTTKDLKKQGFYKLNQLIDVILMTRMPKQLILMGDGFESDPFIYLTLKRLLTPHSDPWKIWNSIKNHNIFKLTTKQDSYFITKFYQLSEMAKKAEHCDIKILIRATEENILKLETCEFKDQVLTELNKTIEYYIA